MKSTKQQFGIRKILTIIALLGLAIACIIALRQYRQAAALTAADLAQADKTWNGEKALGMVNGEPFFQADLDVYSMELRAAVAAHYGRLYNLGGMGADFWDKEFDGQTPRQFMESHARDELVRNMVLIQEARKRGIAAPAQYRDLEDELEAWNAPTDDIVYGPKTLRPAEYVSYRISRITDELKTILLRNELAPTPAQLRIAYHNLDEGLKTAPRYIAGIRFFWDDTASSGIADSYQEIHALLRQGIAQGEEPEALVKRLSEAIPGLSLEEFDLHSKYVSKEDPYDQGLAAILTEAAQGSLVSGPEYRPELFYVTKKEGGHIMAFEEAAGLGRNKWINDRFEIFIDNKIKAARITLFTMNT